MRGLFFLAAALFTSFRGVCSFVAVSRVPSARRSSLNIPCRMSSASDYEGEDPWAELGLTPGASATEIRRAYRRAALRTHPDVNKSPEASAEFKRISSAYELVRDRQKLAQWERKRRSTRTSSYSSYSRPSGRTTGGGGGTSPRWSPPPDPDYDDAGGDSFGAIFGDILRGISSSPRASARGVVDDLLDILDNIPVDTGPRSYETETERRRAEAEQRNLVEKLELMLQNEISVQLVSAKANEAAVKAQQNKNVDDILAAVERTAGLRAKKTACERQLKIEKKELDTIIRARVGDVRNASPPPPPPRPSPSSSSSSTYRSGPRTSTRRTESAWSSSARDRRVDDELNELKRSLGRGNDNKKNT